MGFLTSAHPTLTGLNTTKYKVILETSEEGVAVSVPGLYRAHGFISASLAEKTGFTDEDLQILWKSLAEMFEHDHSAARGEMATQQLIIFKHDDKLGNAPAHNLFDLIKVEVNNKELPTRHFSDYMVNINRDGLPKGVEIIEKA